MGETGQAIMKAGEGPHGRARIAGYFFQDYTSPCGYGILIRRNIPIAASSLGGSIYVYEPCFIAPGARPYELLERLIYD